MAHNWSPYALEYDPVRCGSIDGTDVVPHDRAIVRASSTSYRTNKGVIGDPACTLFIGRLNKDTLESTIETIFASFGSVRRVRLVRDIVTGFSRGYAFVEYYSELSAKNACRESSDAEIDGHKLLVERECERTLHGWVPRRLGGGFGGRKESGQLRFGGRERPFRKPIFIPPNDDVKYMDAGKPWTSNNSENERYKHTSGVPKFHRDDEDDQRQRSVSSSRNSRSRCEISDNSERRSRRGQLDDSSGHTRSRSRSRYVNVECHSDNKNRSR